MKVLLLLFGFLLLLGLTFGQEFDLDLNATGLAVDMDRARLLIKFSNVAYCPEFQVTQWDCVYCREAGLKNFQPAQFLYGQFDTQGYLGHDDSVKTIYVVMQGSSSVENWIANLQFYQIDYDYPGVSGAQVHSGFYKSSKSLFDNMRTKFKGLLDSKPGYKVVVTGHSQGGATGIMVALMIRDEFGIEPEVQTFGEPRVGNKVYADYWKSRISKIAYRFTHKRDPVPQLPPMAFGFHHHPTEVWLQDAHGEQHKVCDNTGEDPTCHNSVILPVAVLDHLIYLNIKISDCQ